MIYKALKYLKPFIHKALNGLGLSLKTTGLHGTLLR